MLILIVEDDPILALDLEGTVLDLGHEVCAMAESAAEAVEAVARHAPDLIMMDFNLAGDEDGAEAAARIRQRSDVPIVFVTAQAEKSCRARMERLSRTRIVPKPHTPVAIAQAIVAAQSV